MSQLKSPAVLHCTRCGKPVVLSVLSTQQADLEGKQLHRFMKAVAAKALCEHCQAQRNYYSSIGRVEDWEAGRP